MWPVQESVWVAIFSLSILGQAERETFMNFGAPAQCNGTVTLIYGDSAHTGRR